MISSNNGVIAIIVFPDHYARYLAGPKIPLLRTLSHLYRVSRVPADSNITGLWLKNNQPTGTGLTGAVQPLQRLIRRGDRNSSHRVRTCVWDWTFHILSSIRLLPPWLEYSGRGKVLCARISGVTGAGDHPAPLCVTVELHLPLGAPSGLESLRTRRTRLPEGYDSRHPGLQKSERKHLRHLAAG